MKEIIKDDGRQLCVQHWHYVLFSDLKSADEVGGSDSKKAFIQ